MRAVKLGLTLASALLLSSCALAPPHIPTQRAFAPTPAWPKVQENIVFTVAGKASKVNIYYGNTNSAHWAKNITLPWSTPLPYDLNAENWWLRVWVQGKGWARVMMSDIRTTFYETGKIKRLDMGVLSSGRTVKPVNGLAAAEWTAY